MKDKSHIKGDLSEMVETSVIVFRNSFAPEQFQLKQA